MLNHFGRGEIIPPCRLCCVASRSAPRLAVVDWAGFHMQGGGSSVNRRGVEGGPRRMVTRRRRQRTRIRWHRGGRPIGGHRGPEGRRRACSVGREPEDEAPAWAGTSRSRPWSQRRPQWSGGEGSLCWEPWIGARRAGCRVRDTDRSYS